MDEFLKKVQRGGGGGGSFPIQKITLQILLVYFSKKTSIFESMITPKLQVDWVGLDGWSLGGVKY